MVWLLLAGCASRPTALRSPKGFRSVSARFGDRKACVLVADSEPLRARGLMDVDQLGRFDAIVFRFPAVTRGAFYMFHTRIALTIAFVGADGVVRERQDMVPCPESEGSACPLYRPQAEYLDAIEYLPSSTVGGALTPGTAVSFGGSC